MQHQELLQAVLARPDEDAPRLAYADWCAQQDGASVQARAEFIRGQIRYSRGGQSFKGTLAGEQLYARTYQLEREFGAAWREPLRGGVKESTFLDGFIEHVSMTARDFLEFGPRMFELAPIRHVDLRDVRNVDERLFESPLLSRLHSLGMDGSGLYSFHIRLLASTGVTSNLQWLSLDHNHLDIGAMEALAESPYCKNLRFASFSGNPVNPAEETGWDSGVLISASMPPEGEELEQRYGYLRWLHRTDDAKGRFEN